MAARPAIPLDVRDLDRIGYSDALALQDEAATACRDGARGTLFLLEHPHVVPLGRNSREEHVLLGRGQLAARGVEVHECGRGGDVTYHGPGQLVGYPVMRLPAGRQSVPGYVTDLEEALIRTLAEFGIEGGREPAYRGVWVGDRKVAAIGVRFSRWVTTHGFALNVTTDLSYFNLITPCGIRGRGVTSMAELLGAAPEMKAVKEAVARHFVAVFGTS